MFKESKTYREDWECYESLSDACFASRDALNLPQEDLRIQSINNIEKFTGMTMMLLNTLVNCEEAKLPSTLPNYLKFLGYANSSGGPEMLKKIAKYLKTSHLLHSQFQIEYLMDVLNKNIRGPNKDVGFKSIATRLTKVFHLSDLQLEQLMVPSYLRNTLHNNGYHTKSSFSVDI